MKVSYESIDNGTIGEIVDGLTLFVGQCAFALDTALYVANDDQEFYVIDEYKRKNDDPSESEACELYNFSHMTKFDDFYGCYELVAHHVYTTRDEMHAHIVAFMGERNHF